MRGWTIERIEEGCLLTNEAVFTATALCSMQKEDERMHFDPDEFFDIGLRERGDDGDVTQKSQLISMPLPLTIFQRSIRSQFFLPTPLSPKR
jgi:hypothetical protein